MFSKPAVLRILLPLFVAALCTSQILSQTPPSDVHFGSQVYNAGGTSENAIVSGDFNADGRPDIAICDTFLGLVQIFINDGSGHFHLGFEHHTAQPEPTSMVTGYFNDDKYLDLAVATNAGNAAVKGTTNQLTILLGNGDGTFRNSTAPQYAGGPGALIAVNLRNDGRTQLVLTRAKFDNGFHDFVDIYQPDPDGVFSLAQTISIPVGPSPYAIVSGDFNHDHRPDIAFAVGDTVMIYKNTSAFDGKGGAQLSFLNSFRLPNYPNIIALAAGHFNGDNVPDLVIDQLDDVSTPDGVEPSHNLYVYLNQGNGTFFPKQTIHLPLNTPVTRQLSIADVNGDGIQDLVGIGIYATQSLEYRLGHGDGTFGAVHTVANLVDGQNYGMVTRDLNRDSRQDIAVLANFAQPNPSNLSILDVLINGNALVNCPSPGSDTVRVKVCSATPGTNSITVKASGNSPAGIQRIELWIDGVKRTQSYSDQLHKTVSVSPGAHRVVLVAVDIYDKLASNVLTVNVP